MKEDLAEAVVQRSRKTLMKTQMDLVMFKT